MGTNTKKIKIGKLYIGGGEKIIIQSMVNKNPHNVTEIINQILELESAGCEMVRITVPNELAAQNIKKIKENINIPLVADIHFNYKLALLAIENGIDKLRINPGNIGDDRNIKKVADMANLKGIPIRIGVNSGSIERAILEKHGRPSAEAMVESAIYHMNLLENFGFYNIVLSLKSSNLIEMYKAYKIIANKVNYPLHLGVTEAGTFVQGTVKSAIGIGALLLEDIGDTIRVSLTEDPVEEIRVAKEILKVTGHRKEGVEIISCPTCGRTKIDLVNLAKKVEEEFKTYNKYIKIAVMGCIVNGPGEAKEADIGIAGGEKEGIIFKKGEIIKKVPEEYLLDELRKVIYDLEGE